MFHLRLFPTALLAVFCLFSAQLGCSNSPPKPDPAPQVSQPKPLEPAADIFARYAPYMPEDTVSVAIMRTDAASDLVREVFASPDEESGQKHLDAMRADFGELFLSHFGVDPLSADSLIFIVSPSAQLFILEGAIRTDFKPQKSIESGGLSAHYITSSAGDADLGAWISPLPNSNGLAVFMDAASFEAAATAYSKASAGLENTPRSDAFREYFSTPETPAISGVLILNAALKQNFEAEYSFSPPDAVSFDLNRDLRVEFRGDEATLDGVKFFIEVFRKELVATMKDLYQNYLELDPYEATGYILTYHLTRDLNDNLEITRGADRLVLRSRIPLGVSTVGILSAFAIPAFYGFLDEPKASESPGDPETREPGTTF